MNGVAGVQVDTDPEGGLRCWLDTGHARGWLTPAAGARAVGTPALFSRHFEAAIAKGFVAADAAVLALMATCHPDALPLLSWSEQLPLAITPSVPARRLDLYAIVDSAERVRQVLAAGVKTLQLRIKTPEQPDPQWTGLLRAEIRRSVAACKAEGAELFINDHWQVAAEEGAHGVHLGQEDLLALGDAGRAALQATGMALGISSHSLWELCRARTLAPRYIACGPVWPTLTKAMPWLPQGLDNLAWWCRMASAPVVAIGGILEADKVFEAARCGADGVCIVRGLGERPETVVPALQAALEAGRAAAVSNPCALAGPHPSLVNQAAPASA
jgi:hydroxymethylpyrimidine kinase/phosphomethylpyrimidine kinase/thiamine-phosphate diphosphorylase